MLAFERHGSGDPLVLVHGVTHRSVTALSPAGFWRSHHQFFYTKQIFQRAGALSDRLGHRTEHLARTRAGRKVIYGVLCARPGRVSPDQALGDVRGFRYARPALRLLLEAAHSFDSEIPVDVPVTIAWAARDLILPPWQADHAKALLPHAEYVLMRGVGHVPMTDDPRFTAEVLLRGSAPAAAVAPIDANTHKPVACRSTRVATA